MSSAFHLLLVDDDHADVDLFRDLFAETAPEIEITHVLNGREALDYLDRCGHDDACRRPDLIVLDLNMPVMNGHEFLSVAKQHARHRSIPVLVLSTSSSPHDIYRSYDSHASGYVVKASSYAELRALVARVTDYWRGAVQLPRIEDVAIRARRVD